MASHTPVVEETPVVCGFVLDTIPAHEDTDAFINKLGGRPVWMNEQVRASEGRDIMLPPPDLPRCRSCRRLLVLVSQLYVPSERYDRVIYVFGCRWGRCNNKRGTWHVIRGQVLAEGETDENDTGDLHNNKNNNNNNHNNHNNENSPDPPVHTSPEHDHPSNIDSSQDNTDSSTGGLDNDLSELLKLRDQKHNQTGSKATPKQNGKKKSKAQQPQEPKWMPALELETDDEPPPLEESNTEDARHRETMHTGGTMAGEDMEDLPETKTDDVFMQFEQRLRRAPGQVVRWTDALDAAPLWVREGYQPHRIPSCSICGRPRQFELQILPTALWKLGVGDQGMDFGVVCIYTCSGAGCHTNGYAEEYVWVQPSV
eukprot:gb/GECH01014686.1/.p1 GENE.gb/GECH01014686.1/~~gb/GECH01014686.1/.p1  ORF type:complete len:370 (+),score=53.92 gb/GECH01014686.1/:1-1110(+)